ncbi:MAG TPA: hypothetical protein VL173_17735 [Vicinamibacterales bacterium]|nr:hypothetical protein [Vicinamibacterales bacterium]
MNDTTATIWRKKKESEIVEVCSGSGQAAAAAELEAFVQFRASVGSELGLP